MFSNSRVLLDEMFQRNASKFGIFYTVGPRIACKFVQKFLRAIRIRTVRDYYLLVSDPNEFKNRVISRNFTVKSHYLRNFSKHYIDILWYIGRYFS